jgi:hypothetical protein
MASCCSLHVRSSAPVAAPAASRASIALLVGRPFSIGVAWWVGFSLIEFVSRARALPALTHLQRSSSVLTGFPTGGETDRLHLAGGGASAYSTPLGGALLASSPVRSPLGRSSVNALPRDGSVGLGLSALVPGEPSSSASAVTLSVVGGRCGVDVILLGCVGSAS